MESKHAVVILHPSKFNIISFCKPANNKQMLLHVYPKDWKLCARPLAKKARICQISGIIVDHFKYLGARAI